MALTETMQLVVDGTRFELLIPGDSEQAQGFQRIFARNGQYEAVMTALVARLLAQLPAPVFADLGAFIGYYTAYAGKLLAGRGQVLAVDSNPAYARLLEAMVSHNGLDNVTVCHAALSDRSETLWAEGTTLHDGAGRNEAVFALVPEQASGRGGSVPGLEGQAQPVATTTLDALTSRIGLTPTIAKMDVHGTEGKVLGGMQHLLGGPLELLLLELHSNAYLRKYSPGCDREGVLDLLAAHGLEVSLVAGHRQTWSDGLHEFRERGRFSWRPVNSATRDLLLFDRTYDALIVASRRPLAALVGATEDSVLPG